MTRAIWQRSVEMLRHRSGTKFEDLAFIDSRTGKSLAQNSYHHEREVIPTKAVKQMLLDRKPYSVIAIHNHPSGSVPSYQDLKTAQRWTYKYGVIVGHNGIVFRYSVKENANLMFADNLFDNIQKNLYSDDDQQIQDGLKLLSACGVDLEVFR